LKLDETEISNPKSEIVNWTAQFEISVSSNFKFSILFLRGH
jgi:hypothetical protein